MTRTGVGAALAFLLVALSCHDSSHAPVPAGPRTFLFGMRGLSEAEGRFVAVTSDPDVLARLEAQLRVPAAERTLHIHGPVERGSEGDNLAWHWRFVPDGWDVVELSTEVCDGTPAMVEADVDGWVRDVGNFCPWSSFVEEEL